MNRRLAQSLVLLSVLLVPAMGWASTSVDGGSDTGKFAQILSPSTAPIVADPLLLRIRRAGVADALRLPDGADHGVDLRRDG